MKKETLKNFIEASKVVTSKSLLVTNYIEIYDKTIYSSGTDTTLKISEPTLKKFDESIMVEMNEVHKIIKNVNEKDIEINLIDEGKKVSLNNRFRFTNEQNLTTIEPLKEVNENKIALPENFMEKYLKVARFVGKDELRPNMMKVRMESGRLVATDAHLLILSKIDVEMGENAVNINHLPKQYNFNSFGMNKDSYTFFDESLNMSISSKIFDERYPAVDQVIPMNQDKHATEINKKELKNLINEALLMCNQQTKEIVFEFSNDSIILSSEDVDFGRSYENILSCKYEGEPIRIGFNGEFLLKVIDNYIGEYFNINMSYPNRAATINDLDDNLFLIMPLMLNN